MGNAEELRVIFDNLVIIDYVKFSISIGMTRNHKIFFNFFILIIDIVDLKERIFLWGIQFTNLSFLTYIKHRPGLASLSLFRGFI